MIWSQLREGLAHRPDVAAICSRYGYDSLDELLDDARDDAVADRLVAELVAAGRAGIEVAVVVLAPRLRRAVGGKRAWTGEDIGELVIAACWERLREGHLPPYPTRSVVGYARKKVLRQLQRSWRQAEATVPLLADTMSLPATSSLLRCGASVGPVTNLTDRPGRAFARATATIAAAPSCVETEVETRLAGEDLIRWVVAAAGSDDQTARIVVASRALGVPMEAVAAAEGLATGTAHKRRQRAEQRIRASVQSGAAALPIP